MKNTKFLLIIFIFIFSACHTDNKEKEAKKTNELSLTFQQVKFNQVSYKKLEKKLFSPIVYAYGKVEVPPQNKVIINTKYGGFIKRILILDGQKVKSGETLLEIEDPNLLQMQQEFIENKSSLEYLKTEMDRQEAISKQEAGSLKNYQLAKSNYLSAKAKNTGLKTRLELAGIKVEKLNEDFIQKVINIVSPFNGIVTKVNIETGEYVDASTHLLEVIDSKHIHAEVYVYEKDIDKLRESQKIQLYFYNQNKIYNAQIHLIGHDVNPDKTIKVHAHFEREPNDIVPGALFKAKIQTYGNYFYSLPKEAVIHHQDKNIVFIKKNNDKTNQFFEALEVNILAENENFVAINFANISGFNNKFFVVNGSYELYSKMFATE